MFSLYTSYLVHIISICGILVLHYTCFYAVPVTDAAAAASANSSQPTTTTQLQTDEKPSSLVVGMYIVTIILRYSVEMMARYTVVFMYFDFSSIETE